MAFRNTPKFFILLFLMVILCKNSAPNRSPSVKDILEEIASSFGDKQLSVLHPQNGTVEQGSVDVTNKLFKSGREQHTFRTTEHYDRIENVEQQPPEDDILYQQSENLNSKPMSNYFQFNSTSDYSDLDGSPSIKDKLDKVNISSGDDGSILSIFNQSSNVSIRPNKKAIESTTDQYLFTENINDLSTENIHNLHTTTLINESLTNFSNQEPVSTTQSSEFSRFVHLNNSDNTFSIDNATRLDDRQSGVLTENIANVSDHMYTNNSSKEHVSKSIETLQNDSSKRWNENDDLLLSIETRVGGPQVTFHENINPDNREISFDIEIATDIFDDDIKPNKSEIVYDSKTISERKFNLARFTRSLNNESDRNNTDHVSDNSTHSNDTHESRSNQEHEMKIDTEEIVSNLFDAGENPLDLLPELDFLESEKLKEAATTATSTNVDSSFIFETRSESVPATMSNEEKSVFDVFHVASRFDLNKNRNVSKTETANTDIGSRSNTKTNLNRTDKIENMSQSGGTTEREKMVVLEPGQNVEISVIQTSPVNKITTESITHSSLSSTTNNNRTDENSTPSNNDFGILNLADSMENSEASSSSHEVLLKTSSKIKEAFVITSKNNLIFFKEKRFDPAHRLRKFLHHSDLNNMKTLYHEQQRRAENLSNSVGHNRTLPDGIVHNANVSQTEEQICSDDCNKLGDSTSDFYFQTDSDYNKNRNERDTQNDNFDPHSLSSNGNGGSVGKKKINIYKELQQITAKKQLDKVSSINDLMSDPSSLSVTTNQEQPQTHSSVFCNFETPCEWKWDSKSGFRITSAVELKNLNVGPKFDANNRTNGHFLFLQVGQTTRELSVVSPAMAPSGEACSLDLWLHQANMNASIIKVVGEKMDTKPTQWIVYEMYGNSYKSWQHYNFMIGRVSQQFRILIEVLPHLSPAHVAIDNVGLVDCWPEPAIHNQCVNPRQYHCTTTNVCVNVSQVCDLIHDCNHGEDEQDCEKIPFGARCDFEDGWCGWQNDVGRSIPWTRNHGSTSMNRTAAQREHTYINNTGHYLLVDMFVSREKGFAATASLSSVIFNPPPSVHSNESSKYYNSCLIRFYYHLHGYHKSGLGLMITELKPKENITSQIWWSYRDNGDNWIRGVVRLPNITNRYYLQFEAKKGLRSLSAVGIDNVSLSPECFGLNIPVNELNGYNYWNPLQCVDPCFKETHKDFINKTYYEFTTCGARGRFGPTSLNCTKAYNNTPVDVEVLQKSSSIFKGVQKWIVPGDGYYTFIAKGASGGRGSSGMGSSRGAVVRAVFELTKGERLHILIGQEGMNACIKSLGSSFNTSCQSLINDNSENLTGVRGVKNMKLKDGGGGGGGATYVFLLQRKNNISVWVPLLVAAGGGGIGIGKFIDSDLQHGQAINMSKKPYSGQTKDKEKSSGAGGGYYSDSGRIISIQNGQALQDGGTGGEACYESRGGEGSGGFGGGGGGCTMGGGGGGYAGGNAYTPNSKNGEGGTSFISPKSVRVYSEAWGGHHTGPGSLLIIPVNNECGCDYRCLALDEYRAKVTCICPQDWFLGTDNITCMLRDSPNDSNILIGLLIVIIIIVIIMLSIIFFALLYCCTDNRYQHNKTEIMRRKMLSGPELQLNRLRMQSDSMMTEYNPSYEFGGVVYTLKDLHEIPRNQLRLVKALGQGAFGEVYQGFYKARQNDAVEMPVAVKTLPEMSTQQAEMDFLMEALIMSKFNHPNIVHFIGVCFDKHPRFIVLELLAGGDLKNFLRESRPKPERSSPLTMKDLVLISIDVAKGCKYMEDNRFIHRDIAARNCLLTTKGPGRVVKIADFGMSRDIYRSDYYRKGGKAMLPIKWMPPEAFLDGIFTSKTDVWSFGVLLWEIMSMGYMPYTGCANRQVMQLVTSGGRLEPPSNCPGPVYGIMTQCWHPNPEQRPTFSQLLERLGYCIQDPDVISNPLPVFTKAPSAERDATVMRPKNPDDSYLQFAHNADYLVPTPTSGPDLQISPHDGSVEKLLNDGSNDGNSDSWETSFMLPQSKSTQPLLQDNVNDTVNSNEPTVQNLINIDTPQLTPTATSPTESNLMNHVNHNHNNNIKAAVTTLSENNTSVMNIKSGVSLDASTLIQQTANGQKKPYVNVMPNNDKTYTTQNGPYTIDNVPHTNNYVNNKKSGYLNNDSEISC